MATVASLIAIANTYLHRTATSPVPWTDAEISQYVADALAETWPDNGIFAAGDVTTTAGASEYAIPAAVGKVSRLDVVNSDGALVDMVASWRVVPGSKVRIRPPFIAGLTLRFIGWTPFKTDASDLPATLDSAIAALAASLAYGGLAASLSNSERQQNLDVGRMVDYGQALQLASYYRSLAERRLFKHPSRASTAPRLARR